jgi:hypothetical protein
VLMIDGSGALACRIFGRLWPVRIVMKRGAIRPLKPSLGRRANRPMGWARKGAQLLRIADVDRPDVVVEREGESAECIAAPTRPETGGERNRPHRPHRPRMSGSSIRLTTSLRKKCGPPAILRTVQSEAMVQPSVANVLKQRMRPMRTVRTQTTRPIRPRKLVGVGVMNAVLALRSARGAGIRLRMAERAPAFIDPTAAACDPSVFNLH